MPPRSPASSSSGFSSSDDDGDDTFDTYTSTSAASTSAVPTVVVDVIDDEPDVTVATTTEPVNDDTNTIDGDEDSALTPIDMDAFAQHVAPQCIDAAAPLLQGGDLVFDYDQFVNAIAIVTNHWPAAVQDVRADNADAMHSTDNSNSSEAAYSALRAALYERFQRAFPLTPDMYTQWLSDLSDSDDDGNETLHVQRLRAKQCVFERALRDYESVQLSLQYAQFLHDYSDVVASFRNRALSLEHALLQTAALHFTQGHVVWHWYREVTAQDEAEALLTPRARQQRMQQLYERQLRIPLQHNDLVLAEFRAWRSYNRPTDDTEASASDKTFGALVACQSKRLPPLVAKMNAFEVRLQQQESTVAIPTTETLESVWIEYLAFATQHVAPVLLQQGSNATGNRSNEIADAFVCTMYERAVAAVCLSPTLWTNYAAVKQASTDNSDAVLALYARAVRNVSFDARLWSELLVLRERRGDAIAQLEAFVACRILNHTAPLLMDQFHYLSFFTTYCDAQRRAAACDAYDDVALERLEQAVETCVAFLAQHFPTFALGKTQLLEYYAKCLFAAAQTTSKRALWTQWEALWARILHCRSQDADVWIRYFHERVRKRAASGAIDPAEIRAAVFEPAIVNVRDYPAAIIELWLTFERENGLLDDVLRVRTLHTEQLAREARAAITATQMQQQQHGSVDREPPAAADKQASETKKRKAKSDTKRSSSDTKRAKVSASAAADATNEPKRNHVPTSAPAPAVVTTEKRATHGALTNAHTLFVSNVSKDVTQDELTAVFQSIPGLQDVRLVVKTRAHHVKSRGMAYVQFMDESGVVAGLTKNRLELKGKPISVERSKPPTQAVSTTSSNSTMGDVSTTMSTLDRDGTWKTDPVTIYVGGLVRDDGVHVGEEGLQRGMEQVLQTAANSDAAAVKRVSILKDRRGKLKDYGLVEFATEQQTASCMVHLADIQRVLGDQITLKPSRFSIDQILHQQQQQQSQKAAKRPDAATTNAASKVKTAAGGSSDRSVATAPRQRMPSLGLMPRALRRKPIVAAVASSSNGGAATAPAATEVGQSSAAIQPGSKPPLAPALDAPSTGTTSQQAPSLNDSRPKTNDDFRKLLMKQ